MADHNATLERSWPLLRPIREVIGRVALCAQNGATPDDMPWDYIDAVFLAGIVECAPCRYVPAIAELPCRHCPHCRRELAEWKVGAVAEAITIEAKERGKWVHMGRVNSEDRLTRARAMGCDSADGTYLAYGPDTNLPKLLGWLYPGDFRFIRVDSPKRASMPVAGQGDLFGEVAA